MEIKIFFILWFFLALVGLSLMSLRNDSDKYKVEAYFIFTKGTLLHKLTYVVIALALLPLSIFYSLKELLK